jgi:hypothetical protein
MVISSVITWAVRALIIELSRPPVEFPKYYPQAVYAPEEQRSDENQIETKECSNCQTMVDKTASFCRVCGSSFKLD